MILKKVVSHSPWFFFFSFFFQTLACQFSSRAPIVQQWHKVLIEQMKRWLSHVWCLWGVCEENKSSVRGFDPDPHSNLRSATVPISFSIFTVVHLHNFHLSDSAVGTRALRGAAFIVAGAPLHVSLPFCHSRLFTPFLSASVQLTRQTAAFKRGNFMKDTGL